MSDSNAEKKFSFGGANYQRLSPPRDKLSGETQVLNLELTLDDALRLGLAIDECCRRINRYKMSTGVGKRARVGLAIHLGSQRIHTYEGKTPKAAD